jgi:hypothetical protein
MKSRRLLAFGLTVSLGAAALMTLLILPGLGWAQTSLGDPMSHPVPDASPLQAGVAVTTTALSHSGIGPASIADSSVWTQNCYQPGQSQTLCFTVYNGSTDGEWLDRVRLTFPTILGNWVVSCSSQDPVDSSGAAVKMACSTPFPNEVLYVDNDVETPGAIGEISSGSSWGLCVNVTVPAGYTGPRLVQWGLSGDEEPGSAPPHDIEGALEMEACTPLMLRPARLVVEGCNGVAQEHEFELWNNTGSDGEFNLTYQVPSGNAAFGGPDSLTLSADEVVTFPVMLEPHLCLRPGEEVVAAIEASGNGQADLSEVVQTITQAAGWGTRPASPIPSMDSVVVWASHADGGLWAIGGYGANGATQRYDPELDNWTVHTPETVITPTIGYPMDGCYGLNEAGDEVVVLFPDTIVTDTLHIYNITHDTWDRAPVPDFYPPEGRWAQDVVSLLNTPGAGQNVCYLSGGSDREGGGRTRDLWRYDPAGNTGEYLGHFPADVWFDFHASWFVPWVGSAGAICVGGGIDHKSQINDVTQCYDLQAGLFLDPNANLGPLPHPWWGMADGWRFQEGRYQIWIAHGVSPDGKLLPASAYADDTTGGFVPGPELPVSLYRLEGDGWNGQFYTVQGAAGGFNYSAHNLLLAACPPCVRSYLPLLLKFHGP